MVNVKVERLSNVEDTCSMRYGKKVLLYMLMLFYPAFVND